MIQTMNKKRMYKPVVLLLAIVFLISYCDCSYGAITCTGGYGISDTGTTNNPTYTHTFTLTPTVGSTAATASHSFRLRTTDNNAWRLLASRVAITRSSGSGAAADNILDTDVSWSGTLTKVGAGTSTLTFAAPFTGTTTLNSISTAGGTVIANGNLRTNVICTSAANYWQVDVILSIPQDFDFNIGTYTGMITYTLQN